MITKKAMWKRCPTCKIDHETEPEIHGCDKCGMELSRDDIIHVIGWKITMDDLFKGEFCSYACAEETLFTLYRDPEIHSINIRTPK